MLPVEGFGLPVGDANKTGEAPKGLRIALALRDPRERLAGILAFPLYACRKCR
jgi:hypothetical protein